MAKKRTSKVWIIITVLVVLSGIAGTLIYVKGNDKTTIVQVEKASRRSITQTVTAIGKIQPETEVKISSEASGEVLQLNAKEGDFINKGKLLVRIQPDLVEAQVEQSRAAVKSSGIGIEIAKVELERAQLELNRVMELYKKEFASKQEWETAKANLDRAQGQYNSALNDKGRAEAALRQIQVSASRTTIYSPISGTVTKLDVEQGEKVVGTAQMQGTEMMRISDLSVINAIVDVDENDVVKVKIGDTARVKIDAFPDKVIRGYVYEISHSPKNKGIGTQDEVINFEVKIRLIDKIEELRPGMSCSVDIETETHSNIVSVPLQAITIRAQEEKKNEKGPTLEKVNEKVKIEKQQQVAFILENGKAKLVKVETGISDKGYIEVKSGISDGATVISGSFNTVAKVLSDGMAVKVESESDKKKKQ